MRSYLSENLYELCALQQLGKISYEVLMEKIGAKLSFEEAKAIINGLRDDARGGYKLNLLWNLIHSSLNKEEVRQLYLILLKEDWHSEFENIIGGLQNYYCDDAKVIEPLLNIMYNPPKQYTQEDFYEPFIRKIIYAIGAQPEPYNLETLVLLTKSDNEIIKRLALHQLEKRKRLGRWEAERNKQFESN